MKYYEAIREDGMHIDKSVVTGVLDKQHCSYASMSNHRRQFSWKFRTARPLDEPTLNELNELKGTSVFERDKEVIIR